MGNKVLGFFKNNGEFVTNDVDKWVGGTCMVSNGVLRYFKNNCEFL